MALRKRFWTWLSKPSSTCPQRHFERFFFEQKLLSLLIMFGHWAKIHRPHGKIFSAFWRFSSRGLSELHSRCPGKFFEGKFFSIFLTLPYIEQKIIRLLSKQFLEGFVESASWTSRASFWGKKIEGFTNLFINFRFWAKILLAFRLNVFGRDCFFCILRVHKDKLKKNVFFKTLFLWSFFGDREKSCQAFDSSFRHGCQNCSQLAHGNF